MNAQILITVVIASFITPIAFAEGFSGPSGQLQAQPQPQPPSNAGQPKSTTTTTKTTYPQGVKGYLDNVIGNAKDRKFHMSVNGKDLPLTPLKIHEEQKLAEGKGATAVDMKGVDGKVYEIDFFTSGTQVTGAKIRRINGKALQS